MQVKDGNFGAAVQTDERTYHAHSAIGMLNHVAHLIAPAWIFMAQEWSDYLAAVGVTGHLEIESPGCRARLSEVWLMRQQNRGSIVWQGVKDETQPVMRLPDVVHTRDVQVRVAAPKRPRSVSQFADAASGE